MTIQSAEKPTVSLYQALKDSGAEISNYRSDLYVKASPRTWAIIKRYPLEHSITTGFHNNIDKQLWYEIPFAYVPFWEEVEKESQRRKAAVQHEGRTI